MIIVFALITLGLIVFAWIYSMYVAWKLSTGTPLVPAQTAPIQAYLYKIVRLSRRTWYTSQVHLKRFLVWCELKIQKLVVRLFPKVAPVFSKRDILTGLTHGPSSYFLKSISKTPPVKHKRLPEKKNMI